MIFFYKNQKHPNYFCNSEVALLLGNDMARSCISLLSAFSQLCGRDKSKMTKGTWNSLEEYVPAWPPLPLLTEDQI
jgi:hypothetical protein